MNTVLLSNLSDDPAGITCSEYAARDIMDNHTARADNCFIADGHAAANCHAAAKPYVVA